MKPEIFSVFNLTTRTNNAVEGYNGVLGRIIYKNQNFFKFVKDLLNEEFSKTRDFNYSINAGGSSTRKKKKYVDKAAKIQQASIELQTGKITALMFINRMTFEKNEICCDMNPEEDLFDGIDYLSEEEDDEEDGETVIESTVKQNEENNCVICLTRKPNTLLMPCRHLKMCSVCIAKLEERAIEREIEFQCPVCRQKVDNHILVFN